jgi:MFS family permease
MMGGLALFLGHQLGFDATWTGYLFGFNGLVGVIVQGGLIGRLVARLGEERLSLLGFISMGLGLALLGTAHSLPWLLTILALTSFGTSVTRPSLTTLLTRSVGQHEQGAALGVSQSLSSIAAILGPMIAGWLINQELLTTYGLVAGGVALLGALLMLRDMRATPSVEVRT